MSKNQPIFDIIEEIKPTMSHLNKIILLIEYIINIFLQSFTYSISDLKILLLELKSTNLELFVARVFKVPGVMLYYKLQIDDLLL